MDRIAGAIGFGCPWVLMVSLGGLLGCGGPEVTRIEVTTYDGSGSARHHDTEFVRASYYRPPNGMVELVLWAEDPSTLDPTQRITQIVYVKEFWNPRPGTTYAEPTQINARVQYALLSPPTGVRYDGAAFLTYRINRWTGVLTGRLESGNLAPRYHMGGADVPFGPARFTGAIRAVQNQAQVVHAVQMLESLFSKRVEN